MITIDKWIRNQSNAEQVILAAVVDLGIKISRSSLVKDLENFPYPYTLLQIHDILKNYNVKTMSIKAPWEKIKLINGGYLCQIKLEGRDYFAYVYHSDEHHVIWLNPKSRRKETSSPSEFSHLFTGYALIVDANEDAGEKNYREWHHKELWQDILQNAVLLSLPVLFLCSLLLSIANGNHEWARYMFAILLFVGCVIGGLLMIHEYDAYNPIVTNVCGKSRKFNCSAILESTGSRFLNIPWTVWGCSYFLGMLLAVMSSGYSEEMYTTVAFLHLLTLPYVSYSLYYQKFIVRQWCPLCLLVQADIVALSLVALCSGCYSHLSNLSVYTIPSIGISLTISFVMMWLMWSFFQQQKLKHFYKEQFQEVKYNPEVFTSLLEQEPEISISTDGYGIVIGNPKGTTQIIKVCNPYCGHCAAAQKVLDQLLETNKNIRLQIIFIMGPDDEGYDRTPLDTFLSLAKEGADMRTILDDWYTMPVKDIDAYNQRHSVKSHRTEENDANARKMSKFCETMHVTATPTFFVNGHQLPALYNVGDLKYFV